MLRVTLEILHPLGFIDVPTCAEVWGKVYPGSAGSREAPPDDPEMEIIEVHIQDPLTEKWRIFKGHGALSDDEYESAVDALWDEAQNGGDADDNDYYGDEY